MSNIYNDLYLISISKLQDLKEENRELCKQQTEICLKICEINELITAEEKLLKKIEKVKNKNKILDISENECPWYTPDDPRLDPLT